MLSNFTHWRPMFDSQATLWVLKGMFLGMALLGTLLAFLYEIKKQSAYRREAEDKAARETADRTEAEYKLERQKSVALRIFDSLTRYIKQYPDAGFIVSKNENNGGYFSVVVDRKDDGVMQGRVPIVQISIDYVRGEKFPLHIHVGSYGADWWTRGEETFFNQVLDLAFDQIAAEVDRLNKSVA